MSPEGIEGGSFFFSRHTKRADGLMGLGSEAGDMTSPEYPHVTVEGVELAREAARAEFMPLIDLSPKDAVVFIGGSSEEERTKETAEIFGDELALQYKDRQDVKVVTREDIEGLRDTARSDGTSVLDALGDLIEENSDKKLVITFPLYLKELSLRPHHREKGTGKHTEFSKKIIAKAGTDEAAAAKEWFTAAENDESVPTPFETAELHIRAIQRLQEFAKRFVGDRPLQVGFVGHGWQLDALALYLANNGKVTAEDFNTVFAGKPIDQAETAKLSVTKDGVVFSYRDKDYRIPQGIL